MHGVARRQETWARGTVWQTNATAPCACQTSLQHKYVHGQHGTFPRIAGMQVSGNTANRTRLPAPQLHVHSECLVTPGCPSNPNLIQACMCASGDAAEVSATLGTASPASVVDSRCQSDWLPAPNQHIHIRNNPDALTQRGGAPPRCARLPGKSWRR